MATFQELVGPDSGSSRLGSTILRRKKESWGFLCIFCEVELIILCFPQLIWVLLEMKQFLWKTSWKYQSASWYSFLPLNSPGFENSMLFSWAIWQVFVLLTTWPSKCHVVNVMPSKIHRLLRTSHLLFAQCLTERSVNFLPSLAEMNTFPGRN